MFMCFCNVMFHGPYNDDPNTLIPIMMTKE